MITAIIAKEEVTRHILRRFNLKASKGLGQNFLISPEIVENILAAAEITAQDNILEVGPGIGTLTQAMGMKGAKVTAVELDERLLAVLAQTLSDAGDIKVVHGDILKVDIAELMDNKPFKLVANLPYYITTPIILKLLESNLPVERLVTMVQKEVAERMVAKPGGRDYGALSVAVQYRSQASMAFVVPSNSFIPEPKVQSAVVVCKLLDKPAVSVISEKIFFRVVQASFSQRRKMLSNCLKNIGVDSDFVKKWLTAADIDGSRRAETLSLQEFADLANTFVVNRQ